MTAFYSQRGYLKKTQVTGHGDFGSLGYLKHKIQNDYCSADMSLS